MNAATRTAVYHRQNGTARLTPRQERRIRHKRAMETVESRHAHWTLIRGKQDVIRADRRDRRRIRDLFTRRAA